MASTTSMRDHELVCSLFKLQKKHSKLVRSTVYDAPGDPDIKIRSWKMSEHHYYTVPSPFPTLARGLFTTWASNDKSKEGEGTGTYRIVARGYDKFYNMGEVPWTTWDAIAKYTKPPYTLSVKSNGCIIFIAALTPSKLLITSKHSLGPIKGLHQSHSQVGEKWLDIHLGKVGRSKEDLARVLWENNWTAVAELCDDSFEEHVLPYSEEQTGLHLHGINKSSAEFSTLPSSHDSSSPSVESFAKEWGFIPTITLTLPDVMEVKDFTDKCATTGSWNGQPLEGFVVRTTIGSTEETRNSEEPNAGILHDSKKNTDTNARRSNSPPYPPGSDFFFKIKFDEPYMMYRDWREITKSYLSALNKDGLSSLSKSKASKNRLKRPETRAYDFWVRREIGQDPGFFEGYQKNRGIVKTRERFLQWLDSKEGIQRLGKEKGEESRSPSPLIMVSQENSKARKTIIVPVAIPGCGKTSVAIALSHLFGFGHVQSDDVVGKKKTAAIFEGNIKQLLSRIDVVIADKNNHLSQHRTALRQLLPNANPPLRLIALHWDPATQSNAELHRICGERIRLRGENHQSLRANPSSPSQHEQILWTFINTSEALVVSEVDDVIDMAISEGIEESVHRAVRGLCKLLNRTMPSDEAIRQAVIATSNYVVPESSKREMQPIARSKATKSVPRYFGLKILSTTITPSGFDTLTFVERIIFTAAQTMNDTECKKLRRLWDDMKVHDRITQSPHVTIVHKKEVESKEFGGIEELWDSCFALPNGLKFKFEVTHLVYNDRIMALALAPKLTVDCDTSQARPLELLKSIPQMVLDKLHITVGTRNKNIKPIEAVDLTVKWRNGKLDATAGAIPLKKNFGAMTGLLEGMWA